MGAGAGERSRAAGPPPLDASGDGASHAVSRLSATSGRSRRGTRAGSGGPRRSTRADDRKRRAEVSREDRSFDRVAHCYDETRAMPEDAHAAITAGIARAARAVAPDPLLLEMGIGTGRIALPLAESGIRIVGIDVARAMLARLRARRRDLPVAVA